MHFFEISKSNWLALFEKSFDTFFCISSIVKLLVTRRWKKLGRWWQHHDDGGYGFESRDEAKMWEEFTCYY